jgi:hypothetical protein
LSDDPQDAAPVAVPVEETSIALLPDGDGTYIEDEDRDEIEHLGYDASLDHDDDDVWLSEELQQAEGRIGALEEELATLRSTDVWQRIAELEEQLALATGPHCSSCGYAIDPDTCHCGTSATHHRAEEHSFVPMGCMCGYPIKPHITEWAALAGRIREQLWRARRQNTAAKDVVEHVRTIVQHWRNQDGFNVNLIDALANALDRFDREPTDG